jgi:prepilin-type N-terminal cleavage/methylation domain-containing protein
MKSLKTHLKGFTLIELLTALMVATIILTAAVTLAYAISSAYDSTVEINEKQARIRCTDLRITDLIRHSKLICAALPRDLVVWRADDNNDNQINVSEIVYIETVYWNSYIRLLQFFPKNPGSDIAIPLFYINGWYIKNWLIYKYPEQYTTLIDQCQDVIITLDKAPPYTTQVNITFNIEENEQVRTYQINSTLRCWAGNLINTFGGLSAEDDD